MHAASRPGAFLPLLLALSAAAWGCLVAWDSGPYARYLHAIDWADVSPLAALCRAVPGGAVVVPGVLFGSAWLLMIAAMMLPTTLPLLAAFRRLVAARSDRASLLALLVSGYVAVWFLFGVAMDGLDTAVHALAARSGWLALHGWAAGAAMLALAGFYQFSRVKYRCLEQCRSPVSFVTAHWHGRNARRDSLVIGLHHGLFCVGCCWSLMVVMFVVGAGSIGWMLALAAVMAIEKNVAWGRALAFPLGVALVTWALLIVAGNSGWRV